MTFTLSRQHRLSGSRDFTRVFQDGRRSADHFFTVLYRANDVGRARIGFAISKKRVAKAVARNRIRRLVRESFRQQRQALGNVDIVVLAQQQACNAGGPELRDSLDRHWSRLSSSVETTGSND